jgi:succinate dehydrogenase / fumarate reductase, cytochrome b subunit
VSIPAVHGLAPPPPAERLHRAAALFGTTVGKKAIMGVTGIVLVGFVVGHMIGNLQVYLGPEAMNDYAVFLREFLHGTGIWIARGGLLVAAALHVWAATSLTLASRRARPVGYREQQHRESTYASRTMRWSGPLLLLFVVYHVMHLTFGTVHSSFVEGDVYHNFVSGFRSVPVSAVYAAAMIALGLHLYHGTWSMLQSLGLSHPRYDHLRHALATLVTLAVVIGNLSFPIAVLTGFLR